MEIRVKAEEQSEDKKFFLMGVHLARAEHDGKEYKISLLGNGTIAISFPDKKTFHVELGDILGAIISKLGKKKGKKKPCPLIYGWYSGEVSDMSHKGDELNPACVHLCGEAMRHQCTAESGCQLEHRKAWDTGTSGAREYLGLKPQGQLKKLVPDISPKQRERIQKRCYVRLQKCRQVFIEFGDKR